MGDGAKMTNLSMRRARARALAAYTSLKAGEESRAAHERQTTRNRRMDLDGRSSRISDRISSGRLAAVHGACLLLLAVVGVSGAMPELRWRRQV